MTAEALISTIGRMVTIKPLISWIALVPTKPLIEALTPWIALIWIESLVAGMPLVWIKALVLIDPHVLLELLSELPLNIGEILGRLLVGRLWIRAEGVAS